jgi:hypothetical protein
MVQNYFGRETATRTTGLGLAVPAKTGKTWTLEVVEATHNRRKGIGLSCGFQAIPRSSAGSSFNGKQRFVV